MKVFCGFFDAFLGTFYDFCEKNGRHCVEKYRYRVRI